VLAANRIKMPRICRCRSGACPGYKIKFQDPSTNSREMDIKIKTSPTRFVKIVIIPALCAFDD